MLKSSSGVGSGGLGTASSSEGGALKSRSTSQDDDPSHVEGTWDKLLGLFHLRHSSGRGGNLKKGGLTAGILGRGRSGGAAGGADSKASPFHTTSPMDNTNGMNGQGKEGSVGIEVITVVPNPVFEEGSLEERIGGDGIVDEPSIRGGRAWSEVSVEVCVSNFWFLCI